MTTAKGHHASWSAVCREPWLDPGRAEIGEVLSEMGNHRIRRLPVIENNRLVSMISEADLARHLDAHQIAEFAAQVYATS